MSCPLKEALDKKVFRPLIWQLVVSNFTLCTGKPANTTQQAEEPPDNTLGLPEPAAVSSDFGFKHPPFPGSKFQNGWRDGGTTPGHESREVTAEPAGFCPHRARPHGARLDHATCTVYQTESERQQTRLHTGLGFPGPAGAQFRPPPPPPSGTSPATPGAGTRARIRGPRGAGAPLRGTCSNR